ncbi:MAG: transposase [Verrucomicrobia bacterium]|nr:transposase [Verrucomicrobiota bacterium]
MLRCQFEGAIYHVMSRGVDRCNIFRGDKDRLMFINKLQANVETHHIELYAYLLMSNHYHLLLMTPRGNLSSFMHQFGTSYTTYFNARHRRSGALFGGRFKAPLVEGDEYLMKLVRYIHLNPVRTKAMKPRELSEKLEYLNKYQWSSHRSYGGWEKRQEWISYAPLDALLNERAGLKGERSAYRKYISAALARNDEELEEALERSSKSVGSESFCQEIEKKYQGLAAEHGHNPDIAMRRIEHGTDPELVLQVVAEAYAMVSPEDLQRRRGNSDARDALIWLWATESGLMGRDVGRRLGHKDGAVVSRRLRELRSKRDRSPKFWRICERLNKELANVKA